MRYLIALASLMACALASASTITYQGQLQDGNGPMSGTPEMEFRLYDALDGDTQIGSTVLHAAVPVTDGLFQVELDFGPVFDGTNLFLEVIVEGQALSPRQAITAAPMAQFAMTPAGPEGPEGASPFELIGDDAVYLQGNVGIGTSSPSVALEVAGSAMFGVGNQMNSELSFVGGGSGNSANANYSVVGGGLANIASGLYSFVGGGSDNSAIGSISTVAGGTGNTASGFTSFAAGRQAKAEHHGTFVWADNNMVDFASTGEDQFLIRAQNGVGVNTNSPANSLTVAGDADFSGAVGIGTSSPAAALDVVGSAKFGGAGNLASGTDSFVSGGSGTGSNEVHGDDGFIGGGRANLVSGDRSFVGGGFGNEVEGWNSFIAGGVNNTATGGTSFIAAGQSNSASGAASFAGGGRAKAEHDGTFVWGDFRNADFASTGENQFLIRALGGMGIGTNAPARDLHIKQRSTSNGEIGLQIERSGSSTNNWAFYVATSDNLGFRYNDTLVARIDTSGQFATLSDARYKTEIEPLTGALERLSQIEPASYRMRMGSGDDEVSVGLIAQQVHQVLPGAVSEEEGTLGVYYNQITALNTAALLELNTRTLAASQQQRNVISEQQRVIKTQQVRIAKNEQRLERVEAKNAALRQLAERNVELADRLAILEALLLDNRQVAEQAR